MRHTGHLSKMRSELSDPVRYYLELGDHSIDMSAQLGKRLTLIYEQKINCINCGRETAKSFSQGYCYPCFARLPECDSCIVSPEKCHHDQGTCRDPAWGEAHCMQPHVVYLSNTSHLKVGITRAGQIPHRWIDQGATQALPIFTTRTRHVAGLIEHALREFVSDRTAWQKMLKNQAEPLDMQAERQSLLSQAIQWPALQAGDYQKVDAAEVVVDFPVQQYPEKIKSINLDKTSLVSGTLLGIRGQYWLLDSGVFNVRKFGGYLVSLEIEDS